MKILLLTPYLPSENSFHAGAQLIFRNIRQLSKSHQFYIISFVTTEDFQNIDELRKLGVRVYPVLYERNRTERLGILKSLFQNILPIIYSLLGRGIFFHSKYNRTSMWKLIKELLPEINPQLIQIEYNVMHHYAALFPDLPKILIQHDISTKLYERSLIENSSNKNRKNFHLAKHQEGEWMKKCNSVVVLTEEDKHYCEHKWDDLPPISVIPPQIPVIQLPRNEDNFKICFIGSFNRDPNNQAVDLLLDDVFLKLQKKIPEVFLVIAGKFLSPSRIEKVNKLHNVKYQGYVEDIDEFLCTSSLMIAPILIGAGLKMKITHALACGTPVLTTPVGAEGIPLNSEEGLYIENYDDGFTAKAAEILSNQVDLKLSGLKGQKRVNEIFSPGAIGEKFEYLYNSLVKNEPSS